MLDSVVCFTYADSSYLPHAVALAESVAFHRSRNRKYIFYLYYTVSDDEKSMIDDIVESFSGREGFLFESVSVEEELPSELVASKSYMSNNVYKKIFCFDRFVSKEKKGIFIDSDVVVLDDVSKLFDYPFSKMICARSEGHVFDKYYRVSDNILGLSSSRQYFNSGVLVFNSEKCAKADFLRRAFDFAREKFDEIFLDDQDALNFAAGGEWDELPHEWHPRKSNTVITSGGIEKDFTKSELASAGLSGLAHFSGADKPWKSGCKHPHKDDYLKYLSMTLFFDFAEEVRVIHRQDRKLSSSTAKVFKKVQRSLNKRLGRR